MNAKTRRRLLVFCLSGCLIGLATEPRALAASLPNIVSRQAITISAQQAIDNVLVLGHPVTVAGRVQNLVVWEGAVRLMPSARVAHLLDVGGTVHHAPHAAVKDMVVIGTNTAVGNAFLLGAGLTLGLGMARTLLSVLFFFLPWVLGSVSERWFEPLVAVIESAPRRTGVQGLLVSMAILGTGIALGMTLIGLPIGVLLGMGYLGAGFLGWTAVSGWVGAMASARFPSRPRALHTMVGAGVLVASINLPVLGVFCWLGAWCMGIGALTEMVRRWYARRHGGENPA